ncbi:MAG: type II restriction enzyme [Candidatus Heimdallarchaeaceae archaeon]
MSLKKKILLEIFKECERTGNYTFTNDKVREIAATFKFKNPFDATKLDHTKLIPDLLKKKNYCLVHLGQGNHKFIRQMDIFYHKFEKKIIESNCRKWEIKSGVLDDYGLSESNILSLVYNRSILNDFLYDDYAKKPDNIYLPTRTKSTLKYWIGNEQIIAIKLQMEIDLMLIRNNVLTIIECKNGNHTDFAKYQLFVPFHMFCKAKERRYLDLKDVNCCYIMKYKQRIRKTYENHVEMYLYTFTNPENMDSIKLIKAKKYIISEDLSGKKLLESFI